MKTEQITPITMPGGNVDHPPRRTHQANTVTAADTPAKIDSKIFTIPLPDRIRLTKLEATNSQAQQIAQQIRHVNQSMTTIDTHLSQMRATLERIVKIYPPYPPGSAERIEALRQFSALRQMIDQVTRPLGSDGPAGAADQQTPSGDTKLSVDRQPLHPGQGGLDIPDMSTNASDKQISGALDSTIAAQTTLQAHHQRFIAEANRIITALS